MLKPFLRWWAANPESMSEALVKVSKAVLVDQGSGVNLVGITRSGAESKYYDLL